MKTRVGMIAYTTYPFDARIRREAESLCANGYEVFILVPRESRCARRYYMDGVTVVELSLGRYQGKRRTRYVLSYLGFLLNAFLVGAFLFSQRGFEVVHVHNMPNFLVFAAVVPRLLGKKVILDLHDTTPEIYLAKYPDTSGLLYRAFCMEEKISCAFAHRLICVTHVQRDVLAARGIPRQKMSIAMNVPDPRRFHPGRKGRERPPSPGAFRLVYHGTLVKRLGIDLIIRAVAELGDRLPGLELYLIGDGDDVEGFKNLSRELGVEKTVHFTPFVPVESLEELLEGMDLGVIGNRKSVATEVMLPVKLLEYVALDIPVIAPRLKAIQYYLRDDMVSYYEPDDVGSMAGRIMELHSDRSRGIENAKRARSFLEKYGWEVHEKEYLDVYRSLDGGPDPC